MASVGPDHLDFELAIGPVELGVAGSVGACVLVANIVGNVAEKLRQLTFKTREVGAAAGHRGEGPHLVVALQIVHLPHRNADAVCASTSMNLAILAHDESDADGKNGYILRI